MKFHLNKTLIHLKWIEIDCNRIHFICTLMVYILQETKQTVTNQHFEDCYCKSAIFSMNTTKLCRSHRQLHELVWDLVMEIYKRLFLRLYLPQKVISSLNRSSEMRVENKSQNKEKEMKPSVHDDWCSTNHLFDAKDNNILIRRHIEFPQISLVEFDTLKNAVINCW